MDEKQKNILIENMSDNLPTLRKKMGVTQEGLAEIIGVSVAFLRNLWKRSTSIETPFWCFLKEIQNGKWVLSERLSAYYASLDATTVEEYYGDIYIALIPKPYLTLEETANDLTNQIIQILQTIEEKFGE